MDKLSEDLERTIAQCNHELARQRVLAEPGSALRRAELRTAERATRLSCAYRQGDIPPEGRSERLMTRSDYLLLSVLAVIAGIR